VGLIAIGAMLVLSHSTKRYIRVTGVILIACIVSSPIVIWKYRNSPIFSEISVLQRLTHISPSRDAGTAVRLLSWGSGLRGALDHPILGWGYNNVYYALSRHYDPRQITFTPFLEAATSMWFDKSHNFFLDLLIERGVIGVLLYFLLLGVIVKRLWRLADRRLAICMAGALISYLISNTFEFDTFGSCFGFFMVIACIASVGNHEPIEWLRRRPDRKRKASKPAQKRIPSFPVIRILVVMTLLAVGLYLQAEIAVANYEFAAARAACAQDLAAGVSWYVDAFSRFSPYAGREKLTCISLIVKSVLTRGQSSQSFDASPFVLQWTSEALAARPQDGACYIALNDMYNNLGIYLNPEFASRAEAFGRKAVELLPKYQAAKFNLGRTYLILNQPARAVELNRRMLQDEDFPLGHWYLGLSLLQNGQRDEAKKEIRKAVEMGYQLSPQNVASLKRHFADKDISELTAGK
jgi:tetratricopeptide (TPR) repeat protein